MKSRASTLRWACRGIPHPTAAPLSRAVRCRRITPLQSRGSLRSCSQPERGPRDVELRIALESLFLKDSSGESRFRVATRAAWYLGRSLEKRTAHQSTIAAAYEVASRAVHTGAVKNAEDSRDLLGAAQGLVRSAILKRLHEPDEPDLGKLVLGDHWSSHPEATVRLLVYVAEHGASGPFWHEAQPLVEKLSGLELSQGAVTQLDELRAKHGRP